MTHEFDDVARLAEARERLREVVTPDEAETVPVGEAAGRTLAAPVRARRAVPHYERAAMDGYAVRAADTQRAGRSPVALDPAGDEVGPGDAAQVHTGSPLPDGADAVVMVERTREVGDTVEVSSSVTPGENVAPVGEDVGADQHLYDAGHRLTAADLGLLRSAGHEEVEVYERPRVSVVPTGEELVPAGEEPEPGEIVETNGLVVSRLVERWGGEATYRGVVTDDVDALGAAIDRDTDHDVVVTTGGTSVGERDLLPAVVGERGSVEVHGLAVKPGHPAGFGVVDDTLVLMLPGYPVSCLVVATQLLRPAVARAGGFEADPIPETAGVLERKIASEPGVRTFARVSVEEVGGGGERSMVTPTRTSGAGVLSSVTLSDGWVVVPEDSEGYEAGREVAVERWDWEP
ncbi:molybdopterin molybdotransferase MoeA [Salinirussus salinus]|uniref:molybdopterin molybdotransferase MoeA n=1 Tax=Salinirussus salinus TaxID=1198300 RepID=UPI0013576E55|nr:gephyrin-like molybdotransferase Glp [Salinirussus salinus]